MRNILAFSADKDQEQYKMKYYVSYTLYDFQPSKIQSSRLYVIFHIVLWNFWFVLIKKYKCVLMGYKITIIELEKFEL